MRPIIDINQDVIVKYLILDLSLTSIKFFIVQGIPGGYIYNGIANIVISLLLIIALLPAFITAYKERRFETEFILLVFATIIFLQFILFPENMSVLLSNMIKMVGMSLGCLIATNALRDYKQFYLKLEKTSKIIICFAMFEFFTHTFLGVKGSDSNVDYDMSFGFFLVVPTVIQFSEICTDKKNKSWNYIFGALGFLMALTMGSRGAVLAIALGCILSFFEKSRLRKIEDFLLAVVAITLSILLYFNYKSISNYIYELLLSHGINSRLLLMMSYGSITNTTGREMLQANVKEMISQHPIIGNGMFSNLSSHNIVYEVILFFGYPIGLIILLILLYQSVKIFLIKDYYKRKLAVIFFSYAIVDSMLNLTVLGKDMFWIFLGLAFSTKLSESSEKNTI